MAAICVLASQLTTEVDYIQRLNTGYFFENTQLALLHIIRLDYVPNYFDILPMYLVLILWVPVIWALSRLHITLALTFSILIYCAAWHYDWELTADPTTGRPWFFNPFNWQLLFFIGFGFGAGWLQIPSSNWGLSLLCTLIVMASIPLGHEETYTQNAFWGDLRAGLEPFLNKCHLGPIRCVHFLAVAYLVNHLFKSNPHWLALGLSRWIIKMGRQSLPIFLCGMGLSYIGGIALDWSGFDALSVAMINLAGLGLMLLLAQALTWLDSKPWKLPTNHHRPNPTAQKNLLHKINALAYDWGKQALLIPFLIALAILPMLLMQTEKTIGTPVPETMVNLPHNEDFQKVNAIAPRPDQSDTVIENQQRL